MKQKLSTEYRITIPQEIRQQIGINAGDQLDINYNKETDQIIITRDKPSCVICGSSTDFTKINNKLVCQNCINHIKNNKMKEGI